MMKTVDGADKVIEHMNGATIAGFEVKIEKRLSDPTVKPKSTNGSNQNKQQQQQAAGEPVLKPIQPSKVKLTEHREHIKHCIV